MACIMPDVFESKEIVARVTHRCDECGRPIPKGEKYERCKGLWDGHWDTYAAHIDCAKFRHEYNNYLMGPDGPGLYGDECVPLGGLDDYMRHEEDGTGSKWASRWKEIKASQKQETIPKEKSDADSNERD